MKKAEFKLEMAQKAHKDDCFRKKKRKKNIPGAPTPETLAGRSEHIQALRIVEVSSARPVNHPKVSWQKV